VSYWQARFCGERTRLGRILLNDNDLEITNGIRLVTRTLPLKVTAFDEVYSGWLFREKNPAMLSRDTSKTRGMIRC